MKTFKLKFLFSVLISTGLLFACSSDDDSIVADDPAGPDPRSNPAPPTTPLDLTFTTTLDGSSVDDGCGDGISLFSHSGQGSDDVTGNFSVDLSYCGVPNTFTIYDLQITLENTAGDKLFLRQVNSPGINDPAGEITEVNSEGTGGEVSPGDSEPSAITEDGVLVLSVVGGTGEFAEVQGELSSRITPSFLAGTGTINFVFAGSVHGL